MKSVSGEVVASKDIGVGVGSYAYVGFAVACRFTEGAKVVWKAGCFNKRLWGAGVTGSNNGVGVGAYKVGVGEGCTIGSGDGELMYG